MGTHIKDISRARRGLETGNNDKYLRFWFEVDFEAIDIKCNNIKVFQKNGFLIIKAENVDFGTEIKIILSFLKTMGNKLGNQEL